MFVLVD